MAEKRIQALKNAAASSAMEGMPLDADDFNIVMDMLTGKLTVQEYIQSVVNMQEM